MAILTNARPASAVSGIFLDAIFQILATLAVPFQRVGY
jgi:hypothetical protein